MATTTPTLKMKLLIDTKAKHVLFAEVDKDVVDFLFSILALPVATIVEMHGKESMCGSFGNLYSSVDKLDSTYVLPGVDMEELLDPTVMPLAASTSLMSSVLLEPSSAQSKSFFRCSNPTPTSCYNYVTDTRGTGCPMCSSKMNVAVEFVPPKADGPGHNEQKASSTGAAKGFVQGLVTYMVKDDLTVAPMSTISTMTKLNTAGVTDFRALQEKTVQLGYTEGLQIVKASLQSKTVLTDVFLSKKKRPRGCA